MMDCSRASWPRLSFGAMNMSAPSPAATSVRHLLKIWSNGCSTTLIVRSGFAARTMSRTLLRAPVSPPPEPYECQRVTSPDRAAGADGSTDPGAEAGGDAGAEAAGDGVAPPPHAATAMVRPAKTPSTRSFVFIFFSPPRLMDGRRGRPLVVRSTADPGDRVRDAVPGGPRLAWT